MKRLTFIFSLFAQFQLIMSASFKLLFDDLSIMRRYRRFINDPGRDKYIIFGMYVQSFYIQSPLECLKLLDRYRGDLVFKVIFLDALMSRSFNPTTIDNAYFNLTTIANAYYQGFLAPISMRIKRILLEFSCVNELNFKNQLEMVSLLIKVLEGTASSEMKSHGISDETINNYREFIAICKFLVRNISIDFANKRIDYYSLFTTLNEIGIIIKVSSPSESLNTRLSKLYALLWVYLHHIKGDGCLVIFGKHRRHLDRLIINLVNEFCDEFYGNNAEKFYPTRLNLQIKILYRKFNNGI